MTNSPKKTDQPNTPSKLAKFLNKIVCGDSLKVLKTIPSESVDCVITSPPYWKLRDYGVKGQIGRESTAQEYVNKLIKVFNEVKRVLKPSGTCWVVIADTYASTSKGGQTNKPQGNVFDSLTARSVIPKHKPAFRTPSKSLCMIPSKFAVSMIEQGWILRNEIIWHKPNAMPQGVKDRFTVDFEKLFFFVKEKNYYFKRQYEPLKNPNELKRRYANPFENHRYWRFDRTAKKTLRMIKASQAEILKRGRNKRAVWSVGTGVSVDNHYAVFPPKLIETPILAGCPKSGIVLDPFMGSGTTGVVARKLDQKFIGIELNPEYIELARSRLKINET